MYTIVRKREERFYSTGPWVEQRWEIVLEDKDIPDKKILERFKRMEVIQRFNPLATKQIITYFKGTHTNVFSHDTNDNQKKMVIDLIEKFLLDNTEKVLYLYMKP